MAQAAGSYAPDFPLHAQNAVFSLFLSSDNTAFASRAESEDAPMMLLRAHTMEQPSFEPKFSLPAGFLFAPFRSPCAATKLEFGGGSGNPLSKRFRGAFTNPYIKPVYGSIQKGSGFGGGLLATSADRLSGSFSVFAGSRYTMKRYSETVAGFSVDPTGNQFARVRLDLTARTKNQPREVFWGAGPGSIPDDESIYSLREDGIGFSAGFAGRGKVRFGAGLDYSRYAIADPEGGSAPFTGGLFSAAELPGLSGRASLVETFGYLEFDGRDKACDPHEGFYLHLKVGSSTGVGGGNFGYFNYSVDARKYLPFEGRKSVLALRFFADLNEPRGDSSIPFFKLARLGGSKSLRGFSTHRFQGNNAMAMNFEYRRELRSFLNTVAFADVGQVFDGWSGVFAGGLKKTYGGGVQFKSKDSVLVQLLVGKGSEGSKIMLGFGTSF